MGSRSEVEMLWNSGYTTVIAMTNSLPPAVQAVSGPIIEALTKHSAAKAGADPKP